MTRIPRSLLRFFFLLSALMAAGCSEEPSSRYGSLGLGDELLPHIPEDHVLAYKAGMNNQHPFGLRGYLKDHYMLQLAAPAPASAAITPDPKQAMSRPGLLLKRPADASAPTPVKEPVRLSVSGPGETAKAFYTLGYERALSVRRLFPLIAVASGSSSNARPCPVRTADCGCGWSLTAVSPQALCPGIRFPPTAASLRCLTFRTTSAGAPTSGACG